MPNTVLVGTQWGDEGKGKVIDVLSEAADIIVRYQGGNNAGHTVLIDDEKYILHLIPSGILHPGKICVIGNGVVVNPEALIQEIEGLKKRGIEIDDRLFLSSSSHITMPYHIYLDGVREKKWGKGKIGTTGRGIGPTYSDKSARTGIRAIDLLEEEVLAKKIKRNLEDKDYLLKEETQGEFDFDLLKETCLSFANYLKPFILDTPLLIDNAVKEGKNILFEGAQGTLLDVDHGTYPYVTSSNTISGGACVGAGVAPTKIDRIIGVAKAYTTRVGEGPFPTEITSSLGDNLRGKGSEYGATTGRPRRCGWLDMVVLNYATRINGLDSLAITKLDVLDSLETIKICVGYEYNGETIKDFPHSQTILRKAKPVYEELPGWMETTACAKSYEELPEKAKAYLNRISELTKIEIALISVGADRSQTIILDESLVQRQMKNVYRHNL